MKINTKAKEPVKIRFSTLKDGSKSVYLDIYHDGRREYRFLKLYLVPERTPLDKRQNENTMVLASKAKSEAIINLTSGKYGVVKETNKTVSELIQVYADYNVNNCRNKNNFNTLISILKKHLGKCDKADIGAAKLTEKDIIQFCQFLKGNGLKDTTCISYITLLKASYKYATRQGLIKSNPFEKVGKLPLRKEKRTLPVYLEKSEVEQLRNSATTDSKYSKDIANAFLFSCFTGLRWSDVVALKPEHVKTDRDGNKTIQVTMQKTLSVVSFPLPKQAEKYMQSNYNNTNGYVFKLPCLSAVDRYLKRWAAAAGIEKRLHFHIARHTFATLAISAGVPVEVVRDFLGHTDIATTLIYAEVTKDKKQREIDKLNAFLSD